MKILVINQCATNKGDRAVLLAILRELARHGVEDITVSTTNPEYWQTSSESPVVNAEFVPWGWGPGRKKDPWFLDKAIYRMKSVVRRSIIFPVLRNAFLARKKPFCVSLLCDREYIRALERSDIVISTGGHHLTTIIAGCMVTAQVFDMMLALMYGKPLFLWSQSIGTFDFRNLKNKLMVRRILSDADQIFIRDERSESEVKQLGVPLARMHRTRESVFGLYDLVGSRIKPSERDPIMGLSVWTGRKTGPGVREGYIDCLVQLVNHAIDVGYRILLFPMELEGYDVPFLREIITMCKDRQKCEILEGWPDTTAHINAVSRCRMFVGHKTHSVIFSLTTATPLIAIAYHEKTMDFMAQFGIKKNCVYEHDLTGEKLVNIFDTVNSNLDAIHLKIETIALNFSEQVRADFSNMIAQCRLLAQAACDD